MEWSGAERIGSKNAVIKQVQEKRSEGGGRGQGGKDDHGARASAGAALYVTTPKIPSLRQATIHRFVPVPSSPHNAVEKATMLCWQAGDGGGRYEPNGNNDGTDNRRAAE